MAQPSPVTEEFAQAVIAKWKDENRGYTLEVHPGRVYDKISVHSTQYGGGGSAFAFVGRADATLIKPGGWKAPQKNADGSPAVRFRMDNEVGMAQAVAAADPHGGFLYLS